MLRRWKCEVGLDLADIDGAPGAGSPLASFPVFAQNAASAAAKAALIIFDDDGIADDHVTVRVVLDEAYVDDEATEDTEQRGENLFTVQCYDGFDVERFELRDDAPEGA